MVKKYILISFFFFSLLYQCYSQISKGGIPPSFITPGLSESFEVIDLPAIDITKFYVEDSISDNSNFPQRIAANIPVEVDITTSGTWEEIAFQGRIWRIRLSCSGALALNVQFDEFYLPPGSELFLYNHDKSQVLGAYTSFNNFETSQFSTELIKGDEVILEYFEPSETIGSVQMSISEIAFAYRNVSFLFSNSDDFGDSEWCEVNVNCSPEGNNWQDEKRGVARILFKEGFYWYWCTGSLVNNTSQNGVPYFLTADHCGGTASTSDRNQWIFYFNYESSGCSNPGSSPSYNSLTGAALKARGLIDGGSDFQLVQLNSTPPAYFNVYYNGWDRSGSSSSSGVGIHHPSGDIKKISTYTSTLTSATWNGSGSIGASNAHWRTYWSATTNGHGVSEGGSSGSPIFNSSGRILGTLTGGSSSCSNTGWPDLFGKFYYHWQSNGTSSSYQLKPWLDPNSSGVNYLNGYDPNAVSPPDADFTADNTGPDVGQAVHFIDLSNNSPTSWSWYFDPSTITYTGGTSSTSKNPQVVFNAAGSYTVTLVATNSGGNDTETKTDYISASSGPYCFASGGENFPHIIGVQIGTINNTSGQDNYADYTTLSTDIALNQSYDLTVTNGYVHQDTDLGIWIDWNQDDDFEDTDENVVCEVSNEGQGTFSFSVPGAALQGSTRMRIRTKFFDDDCGFPCGTTTYGEVEDYSLNIPGGNPPVSDFSAVNLTPGIGEPVLFYDLSTNDPTSWSWTFTPAAITYAGGTTATSQNPQVQFDTGGNYSVELTSTNINGSDTETKTDYITVLYVPVAEFEADNLTPGIGETVLFTDLSTNNPTLWEWVFTPSTITFTGGTTATSQSPQVHFEAGGNYTVELTATNISGSDSKMKTDFISVTYPYIDLELIIFLEGPLKDGTMNTDLLSLLPLNQPFNESPWYYNGTETVASIPGTDIVDWILVELRDANTASLAIGTTAFEWQAAFIRDDGLVVNIDGNPVLHFESYTTDSLYVLIHHRNHLSIMSAFGLEKSGGVYSYNFSLSEDQTYGSQSQKLIGSGIWGMYGGDGNRDGSVDILDKSPFWENESGLKGYFNSDFNLDGESGNNDKNDIWLPNEGKSRQLPD